MRNMEARIEQNMRSRMATGTSALVDLHVNLLTSPVNDPGTVFEIKWLLQGIVKADVKGGWGLSW